MANIGENALSIQVNSFEIMCLLFPKHGVPGGELCSSDVGSDVLGGSQLK